MAVGPDGVIHHPREIMFNALRIYECRWYLIKDHVLDGRIQTEDEVRAQSSVQLRDTPDCELQEPNLPLR